MMPQTKTFTRTGTVQEILSALQALQAQDELAEKQVRRCGRKTVWWWVGFVVSGIATIIAAVCMRSAGTGALIATVVFGAFALVSLVSALACGRQWKRWDSQNYEDRRMALAVRFFGVLGQDIPPKVKCTVTLNSDGHEKHGKLLGQTTSGEILKTKVLKYEDVWFEAQGRLHDGNRFKISVAQGVTRREKEKRKYWKITERMVEKIALALRIAPEAYPNWQQLPQTLEPASLNSLTVTRASVQDGLLRVIAVRPPHVQQVYAPPSGSDVNLANGDALLQVFMYAYDKLQACRPQGAPGPAAAEGSA